MKQQPSQSLTELAVEHIDAAFPDQYAGPVRVVWWDDGGYLEDVVASAAEQAGVGFRAAQRYPLDLREGAVEEEIDSTPQVWYIPDGKDGRDWFRDIKETGGEVTSSLEALTADLYGVDPWEIFDAERHDPGQRDTAADIILNQFGGVGTPTLDKLREKIITKGEGQLLDHLLNRGWPDIDRDPTTRKKVIGQLQKAGIPVDADQSPEAITDTVRNWAVARWLVASGVDESAFPEAMRDTGDGPGTMNPLKGLLETRGSPDLAEIYLAESYWEDVIADLTEPWTYADCPVDGALDAALWEQWTQWFADGKIEHCIDTAHQRQETVAIYAADSAWARLWEQAGLVAELKEYLMAWESRSDDTGPFEAYADHSEGSWRIDDQVLQLQLTGTPEAELPDTHPAVEWLAERRNELTHERYREYIQSLGDEVRATLGVGDPLANLEPAYKWWVDRKDEFTEAGNVAILFIDALRFDLAQHLAAQLESEYEVRQETRLSVLPSETKFGMAALTPGDAFRFQIGMDGDTLSVNRGGRSLGRKSDRIEALEDRGWTVPADAEEWGDTRIGYYDKELDDVGEGEIGDIEAHFRGYIDSLYDLIERKLDNHSWDRIYVVTDHGFVLFPDTPTMEAVDADEGNVEVKYRRVAGDDVEGPGNGIVLEAGSAGANYLDTNLRILADPRQHFSKQNYNSQRYFHGGLLPQECLLSFLRVE